MLEFLAKISRELLNRTKILWSAVGVALILIPVSTAMPPHPELVRRISLGKAEASYYLSNLEGLRAVGIDAGSRPLFGATGIVAKPGVSGNFKILTLLVDFSDKPASVNAVDFDSLIYINISGSVNNFYRQNSYNALSIVSPVYPSVLGWYRAPQTYAYYTNNQNGLGAYPQNAQKLVEDIVNLADPYVDFSQFDNDSDGYVDGLIIAHAGPGAEFTGNNYDIWSHQWSITPRLKDGVNIYTYSMNPEYWTAPGDITLGVYSHELGHILGLPDLYDTDYSSKGIGNWSLMAGGSWNGVNGSSPSHFDAWSKIFLGFVTPTVPIVDQNSVSFPQVETNSTIYKLWTNGSPGLEYFLVENRQKNGYDTYLPSSGMLIWHVDDSKSGNDSEWWPGSGFLSHYEVAAIQADNLWELEKDIDYGDSGDPYPGSATNRTFSSSSSPNSNSYAGTGTLVSVVNISNSGATMTADIAVGSPQDIQSEESLIPEKVKLLGNVPNPFNPVTMIEFELTEEMPVRMEIFNLNGQKIRTLADDVFPPGIHQIKWDGRNSDLDDVSSGVYFYRIVGPGVIDNKKMLKLK